MFRFRKDTNAQMVLLEAVFFTIMVLLSLIMIFNISPPSQSTINRYSNQLKILADDSLRMLDNIPPTISDALFHNSLLVQYIVLNDTKNITYFLNSSLPSDVGYNLYISNGENSILWYNGENFWGGKLGEVSRANYLVLANYNWVNASDSYPSKEIIPGYKGNEYIVVLEVWNIL
jgi:hypothetical protein